MTKKTSLLFSRLALLTALTTIGCSVSFQAEPPLLNRNPAQASNNYDIALTQLFGSMTGCLIIRDIESGTLIHEFNAPACKRRFYPASSFKVALAVMGFDSGILKDEHDL